MIVNKLGKVTIYVEDQQTAKLFWLEKMGYIVVFEQPLGPDMTWLEVAPSPESETTFVLYNKAHMASMGRGTPHPGVLLSTKDIESSYEQMKKNGVRVGQLNTMPYGKMFDFEDQDGNSYMLREDQ